MAASAGSIRAGRAYVEITARDQLTKTLSSLSKKVAAMGAAFSSFGSRAMVIGSAVTAPLAAMTKIAADSGAELFDMSKRTGMSAQSLSILQHAAGNVGTDMAGVESAIRNMQKTIAGVADDAEGTSGSLEHLGLVNEQIAAMPVDQQFQTIAQRIADISDPAQRAAAAMKVFGRSGTAMIPIGEGLDRFTASARRLNLVKTDASVAQAKAMADSVSDLMEVSKSLAGKIGAALFPAIKQTVESFTSSAVAAGKWIEQNKGLVVAVAQIGVGFMVGGAAIFAFGKILTGTSVAVGVLSTATSLLAKTILLLPTTISAVAAAIKLLLAPMTILTIGLAAFGYHFLTQTGIAKDAINLLKGGFDSLADTAAAAWSGITAAMASGDLATAANIAWSGVKLAAMQALKGILEKVNQWGPSVVDYFWTPINVVIGAFYGLQQAWADVTSSLKLIWLELSTSVEKIWIDITSAGTKIWNKFAESFPTLAWAIETVWNKLHSSMYTTASDMFSHIMKGWVAVKYYAGAISEQEENKQNREIDRANQSTKQSIAKQYALPDRSKYYNFSADDENKKVDADAQRKKDALDSDAKTQREAINNSWLDKIKELENKRRSAIETLGKIRSGKEPIISDESIAELESTIKLLKGEFTNLTNSAIEKARNATSGQSDDVGNGRPPIELPDQTSRRIDAMGSFGVVSGRQFNVGAGSKLENLSEQTAKNTKRMVDKLDKGLSITNLQYT